MDQQLHHQTLKITAGTALPESSTPILPKTFGDYELLEEIGRGGMGVVIRARQVNLNREVALKMVLAGQWVGEVEIKRFLAEAEFAASLDHPNIVPIYEVGQQDGVHFYTMKLIQGRSLVDLLPMYQSDFRAAIRLMAKIARAVHYAHQAGILHRDLKPGNILVDEQGEPHVTDFGLAKHCGRESNLTLSGMVMGTPSYMAPEQAMGKTKHLTTAADIFSLGAMLYHMLTGHAPFETDTPFETLRKVVEQEPVRPRQVHGTIDRELETICLKCLEKDPARRYGSAEGLADDLERWLRKEPILARRASLAWRLGRWVQRKPALATMVLLLHVIAGLGLAGILRQWHRAETAEHEVLQKLRDSYLAQAQARRLSGQPGRRIESLDVLAKAAAIQPGLDLRNEAIACLALSDLKLVRRWQVKCDDDKIYLDSTITRYATAETNGNIVIRRLSNDAELARVVPSGNQRGASGVELSPDGRWLRITQAGSGMVVWDLAEDREILSLERSDSAFSHNGNRFVVAPRTGGLEIYDLPSGKQQLTLSRGQFFYLPAFDPMGEKVAAVLPDRKELAVFDIATGQHLVRLQHQNLIHVFTWHPEGRFLVATEKSQTAIIVWDLETGRVLKQLDDPQSSPVALSFNHDGSLLASGGWDGRVRIWDLALGRQILVANGGGYVTFSGDGQRLGVVSWRRNEAWFFDIITGNELRVIHEQRTPSEGGERIQFNRDGSALAYTIGRYLKMWDPRTGRTCAVMTNLPVFNMVADTTSSGFFLTCQAELYYWPVEAQASLQPTPQLLLERNNYRWSDISADGKSLLAQHGSDHCHIYNREPLSNRAKMKTTHPGMRFLSLSPDGQWVASGAWHNLTVKIWNARSGELVRTIPTEDMSSVLFSPDSRMLVLGGKDYQFLEVGSWKPVLRFSRPPLESFPPAMDFTKDGKLFACCDTWTSVKLVNPITGQELAILEPPNAWNISGISFNADATLLGVAGNMPEFHIWDLRAIRRQLTSMGLDWETSP